MRPSSVLSSVLLLAATTSAWPSMLSHPVDAFKREIAPMLVQRQDSSSDSSASSEPTSSVKESATSGSSDSSDSGSKTTATATTTSDNNSDSTDASSTGTAKNTGTAKSSGSETGTATGSESGSKTTKKSSSTNSNSQFDARLPAGGASMITPNALSAASYYKIADQITFAWNYTSLSKDPAYVDVLATCTANNALYTIAANETFEQLQTVIWDTGKYQSTGTIPLLTETYTLIIHDAAKDISATASAGYLGTVKQYTFGMYEPQPYTPMADYVCATCNSAMSLMEKQTYGFLLSMVGVTVFTFGWFTGTAGLW